MMPCFAQEPKKCNLTLWTPRRTGCEILQVKAEEVGVEREPVVKEAAEVRAKVQAKHLNLLLLDANNVSVAPWEEACFLLRVKEREEKVVREAVEEYEEAYGKEWRQE